MSETNCKNCGHILPGNFCSNCGQPAQVHKIDAHHFLHDIPHSILHVDKGLPFTFTQLIKRPGDALKDYLEGKRIQYFRPFGYVITMSAISSLLVHWMQLFIQHSYLQQTGKTISWGETFFTKYKSLFIFLMIPLVSLCTWLVFKKHRYNFWEHLLVNTYLAAQLNVLLVLMQLFIVIKFLIFNSPSYHPVLFLTGFITGFMFYYATTFSTLMKDDEKTSWKLGLKLALMCFLLASFYSVGMAFTGMIFHSIKQ